MKLLTLGGLSLADTPFTRVKPLLLLAYVALEGVRSRRHLAELFWGDAADPLDSLSGALKQLKQHAPGAVAADKQQVWSTALGDAETFLAAVEAGRYAEALELYGGPFLRDVYLPGWGAELEEWVYGTREFLAARARAALLRLAEQDAAKGDFITASRRAETALLLPGAPELEPGELNRVHALLAAGESPQLAGFRKDARGFGLELSLTSADARERLQRPSESAHAQFGNLPVRLTSFVGRDDERSQAAQLLSQPECSLLTLTGPGGVGKSRLALQVARDFAERYPDGVFYVPLEALRSPSLIASSVASALSLGLQGSEDPLVQVARALTDRELLLVLDNFEQLLSGAALLSELLGRCPQLKLLVTSRERLGVEEEWVLPLSGLPVPESLVADELPRGAAQLFAVRARQASLAFSLTRQNAPFVLDICRLVGGSPLGIELAAAWVRVLSPEAIAQEIAADLDFLTSVGHRPAPRHRSVRAAFEHSWRLLSPTDQAALGGLSVFEEGFRRDAASEVVGVTIPVLASLVDKSLLRVTPEGRYDRHPLVYQYAREKLEAGERERLERLHANVYVALAEALDLKLTATRDARDLELLEAEHGNLRAALRWSVAQGGVEQEGAAGDAAEDIAAGTVALRLAGSLGRFWEMRGYLREGCTWLQRALGRYPNAPAAVRAKALVAFGRLTLLQGELTDAKPRFEEGLSLWRLTADALGTADALNCLGLVAMEQEDYRTAKSCYQEGLELYRALGNKEGISILLNNFGELARCQNDYFGASAFYEESLALLRETGNKRRRALVLSNLGAVSQHLGDNTKAERLLKEGLALKYEMYDEIGLSYCFAGLASVSCALGEFGRAALLFGVVDGLLERTKHQLELADRHDLERSLGMTRAQITEDAFVRARAAGRALSLERAVAYGLAADP